MAKNENNAAKEQLKKYLDNRAATDELFAVAYAKENKNLDECMQYILTEMRKRGSAVFATDEEVYGLAVHYYDEDELEIDRNVRARVQTAPKPVELTEEEKQEAREAAKRRYQDECIREMQERDKKRRAAKPKQETGTQQMSLFDFMEEEE